MNARTLPALLLGGAVALVVAGCAAPPPGREAGPPRRDVPDLAAIHTAGASQFDGACLGCHGDIMTRKTASPKFKEAHAAMIPFLPDYDPKVGVTNATCQSCHTTVDVVQHSGMQIRKNADVASCTACHGRTGMASRKFYAE
ncbi:MAG: hypothetical protein HY359_12825 [Candidatus Rokubacteria bacterium]|nr:hypothetical protein [Candidatus Rokubacteria bacterium]